MPAYSFCCKDCGTRKTEFVHKYVDLVVPMCLECNKKMNRDWGEDRVHAHKDSYSRPIHSDSLAISESQRKEHERLFPYIKLDHKCRPIFDNYRDHQRYLDETGFVKNPGKSKRKSVKIS